VGFLATPNLLLYGTAGLAYGETEVSFATAPTAAACGPAVTCSSGSSSSVRAGWTVGTGGEWKFAPRWSAKLEYLYVDLGSQSVTATTTALGPFAFTATAPFREHVVRAGINYSWNSPVIAKY
jgi:outer membrane immunogenic protein